VGVLIALVAAITGLRSLRQLRTDSHERSRPRWPPQSTSGLDAEHHTARLQQRYALPNNDEPRYRQIAKDYRNKIISGELHDGDKLPAKASSQNCTMSRPSQPAARKLLREWGLAYGVKGKGVFVRRPAQLIRIAPQRYFRGQETRAYVREAEASAVGLDLQHQTTRTTAPADSATRLGIAEGDPVS
jgi:DNA-binding GntR family transcriptional regulator